MDTFFFHLMPYRAVEGDAYPFASDAWDPETGARYYHEYLGQLEYAAELGFDGLGFNEHHFSAYGLMPSPVVVASYLAGRTDDVALGFFGNVLPVRANPVRLAEELAMVDNISEGRVISGFPRGITTEYLAYNVPQSESRSRMAEAWDLVERTWTAEEPFDHDGEHFQFENVYAWPRPYQQPHPPLWMPASSEESLRFAAERELPIGTGGGTAEMIGETFDRYRELAEEYGWTPTDEHFTVLSQVYVGEETSTATAEVADHLEFLFERLFAGVHVGAQAQLMGELYDPARREAYVAEMEPYTRAMLDYDVEDSLESGTLLVGGPEDVAARIEELYDVVGGFGTLVGQFHVGSLPDDLTRASLRRYAEEVAPAVDGIGGDGLTSRLR